MLVCPRRYQSVSVSRPGGGQTKVIVEDQYEDPHLIAGVPFPFLKVNGMPPVTGHVYKYSKELEVEINWNLTAIFFLIANKPINLIISGSFATGNY